MGLVWLRDLGIADPMVMPDWVFGDRRPLRLEGKATGATMFFVTSDVTLPGRMVVWQVGFWLGYLATGGQYVRLGLVGREPVDEAGFLGAPPLLEGFGEHGREPRRIFVDRNQDAWRVDCRLLVVTGGMRICAGFFGGASNYMGVTIVYSVVPERVPEWVGRRLVAGGPVDGIV
jgi:hypothetical protein